MLSMWKPSQESLDSLKAIFKDSLSDNNQKHLQVYQKITEFSKNKEISNYLIYILNDESNEIFIRQISGLTLKNILEREFNNNTNDNHEFFRQNILKNYFHENVIIRKTISNVLNTYIRQGGLELWPEILEFLNSSLENKLGTEISLETLNLIFEDNGSLIEEKHSNFVVKYINKIVNSIQTSSFLLKENFNNMILILTSIEILIENCGSLISDKSKDISEAILQLHYQKNYVVRCKISRCWMSLFRLKSEVLKENFEKVFEFFLTSLCEDNYELNYISAEFFLMIVEDSNSLIFKESNYSLHLKIFLDKLLPSLLINSKLTKNDHYEIENKFKSSKNEKNFAERPEPIGDEEELESDQFNSNITLRKICARIIDRLSNIYSEETYNILKVLLENDIKNPDWIIQERSILILGAISEGSYEYLRPNLSNLVPFLIYDLQNQNKFIRAISCWTLSRFSKFIMCDNLSENSNELFKNFLAEILKRVMDTDQLVQESACSTFSHLIKTKKEKLEPYLNEVFQVLNSILNKYSDGNLLSLYDIIIFTCEEYAEFYKSKDYSEPLTKSIVIKWFSTKIDDYKSIVPIFDVFNALVKVSGLISESNYVDFIKKSIFILDSQIEIYKKNNEDPKLLDKEIIVRCLDLLSIIILNHSEKINQCLNNCKIMSVIIFLIKTNDIEIKHYCFALIGDVCKTSQALLVPYLDSIIQSMIKDMECPVSNQKYNSIETAKLHVCNNTTWTVGLLVITFKESCRKYLTQIMNKLLKILSVPRLNKSLAQNVSICIGRISLAYPDFVAQNLDFFLKQFCISLRLTRNSEEKHQAFRGLCQAIIQNPNGVINHFAYLCDAICNYENPPKELESVFQNIILSYKSSLNERWNSYFLEFPKKLQVQMKNRFNIQ